MFLLLDERAMNDPDDALTLDMADTLGEAKEAAKDHMPCVIWDTNKNEMVEYVTREKKGRKK